VAIAEIHGKSPLSTSEDFLTADVFTAFRYLPAASGLIGFLCSIPGLGDLLPPAHEAMAQIHFWPLGSRFNREPDLLLELNYDDRVIHIVVEAKYRSGPSDKDSLEVVYGDQTLSSGRQLVDEFLDLSDGKYTLFRDGVRDHSHQLTSRPADRYLLYLTAHPVRPETELSAAVRDHQEMAGRLFWASWYRVFEYLQNLRPALTQFPYDRILADICLLLERKGFFTFHGFHYPFSFGKQNAEFVFWQDVRPGPVVFGGFIRPPEHGLASATSVFWQAHNQGR
jgi:hypothetical protein